MKILYGVAGEGAGHAIRSKAILEELQKKHQILIAAGGKAYNILNKEFNTLKISFFRILYRSNSVSFLTFPYVILKLPFAIIYNLKLIKTFIQFRPDIIITDFEPFTCYLALLFNKKCISIDNQHIINTDLDIPDNSFNKFILHLVVRLIIPKADNYLITTFFFPKIIKDNAYLFYPINRKKIIASKSKEGKFILVYQTSKSNKDLLSILKQINSKFIVYGFDKKEKHKNVQFKKFDEKGFIKDLSDCKAIITNGGFTVIGESLYLQKPILSIPVKNQLEQIINAVYLEKLGYGKYCKTITKKDLQDFLSNLKLYKINLKKYKKQDNSKIIKKLRELLNKQ